MGGDHLHPQQPWPGVLSSSGPLGLYAFKILALAILSHSPWPKVLTFWERGLAGEGKGSYKQLLEEEVWRGREYRCDWSFSYFLLKIMGCTLRDHKVSWPHFLQSLHLTVERPSVAFSHWLLQMQY